MSRNNPSLYRLIFSSVLPQKHSSWTELQPLLMVNCTVVFKLHFNPKVIDRETDKRLLDPLREEERGCQAHFLPPQSTPTQPHKQAEDHGLELKASTGLRKDRNFQHFSSKESPSPLLIFKVCCFPNDIQFYYARGQKRAGSSCKSCLNSHQCKTLALRTLGFSQRV